MIITFAQKVKIRNYVILIKAGQMSLEDVEEELKQLVIDALNS